jgi:hypothetical protein
MKRMRLLAAACVLPLLLLASPVSAITSKQKMETCKFGADEQKLTGAKRTHFISRCMANENDKPKTTAMKPAAPKPAAGSAEPPETDKE